MDQVNDVSGGTLDSSMLTTVAELNVPYVISHMVWGVFLTTVSERSL
jgi:dihydropteroate synthase